MASSLSQRPLTASEVNVYHPGRGELQQMAMTNYQNALDKDLYQPLVENLIQERDNMNYVAPAAQRAAANTEGLAARTARNASRYGQNLSPAQMAYQQQAAQRGGELGMVQAKNNARMTQYGAEQQLTSQILGYGDQILGQVNQGASTLSANHAAREQQYQAGKAQQKQNTAMMAGAAVMMAAMFI